MSRYKLIHTPSITNDIIDEIRTRTLKTIKCGIISGLPAVYVRVQYGDELDIAIRRIPLHQRYH